LLFTLSACEILESVGTPKTGNDAASTDEGKGYTTPVLPRHPAPWNEGEVTELENPPGVVPDEVTPTPSPSTTPVVDLPNDALPRSIASLGDSITAGALAHLDRRNAWQPGVLAYLTGEIIGGLFVDGGMVEDLEKKHLSWSTGLDDKGRVWTHARRLERLAGYELAVGNFAVSGSEAKDVLDEQVPELLDWSRRELGQGAPDYVTLLIGANDICADDSAGMTSTDEYKERVKSVVSQLVDASEGTKVLVSTVPDIASLKSKAENATLAPPLYNRCKNLWETMKVCPTLTRSTGAERERVRQRVKDYNTALGEIVAELRAAKGDRVRIAGNVATADYGKDHVSVDCFHPNPDGQQLLADKTWQSSWWASDYQTRFHGDED
jgi:lysophospholipase L1-like esterase